jgi:hypothetical protein
MITVLSLASFRRVNLIPATDQHRGTKCMSSDTVSARVLASRRNGAKSRGPRTAAGKARVAKNALKHGLSARTLVVLDHEDAGAFAAFEAAVRTELAPVGDFQALLVARIVASAWRAHRADRVETAVLRQYLGTPRPTDPRARQAALGFGLVRDGNGARAFDTLVRYRGSVLAQLFRALAMLKRVQAETEALARLSSPATKTKQTQEDQRKQ